MQDQPPIEQDVPLRQRRARATLAVLLAWIALAQAAPFVAVAQETDRLGRAIELNKMGRKAEARTLLHEVVAEEPGNHRALWNMGLLAMSERKYDDAIRWFDAAIEVDGLVAEYPLWRGYAYTRKLESAGPLGKLFLAPKIRGSFEEAVRLAPRSVPARRALMQYYERAPALLGGGREKARRQAAEIRALQAVRGAAVER